MLFKDISYLELWQLFCSGECNYMCKFGRGYHKERTSDGGNGNHSVSLPIILIKIKFDQMLPSSHISSLLVSIL